MEMLLTLSLFTFALGTGALLNTGKEDYVWRTHAKYLSVGGLVGVFICIAASLWRVHNGL